MDINTTAEFDKLLSDKRVVLVDLPEELKKQILSYILNENHPNTHYFNNKTKLMSDSVLSAVKEDVSIDVDGYGYIDALATPSPRFDGTWPAGLNPDVFPFEPSSTSTSDKIDSMVRKTLEYHYTISALNKGGEEMN